jgi:hypothetical protein
LLAEWGSASQLYPPGWLLLVWETVWKPDRENLGWKTLAVVARSSEEFESMASFPGFFFFFSVVVFFLPSTDELSPWAREADYTLDDNVALPETKETLLF